MRIKPKMSLGLRLVSQSDHNLWFVNSSSCTGTFASALRNFVRLHCEVGDRTDTGIWRHPATPNPRAVRRVACKGLHHHRASSKRFSKTNTTHCPRQQNLLLNTHWHGAALKWASITAYGHLSCVRKIGQGRAQEMEHLAQKSPAGDV